MKSQRTDVDGDAGGQQWMNILVGVDERRSM